MTLVASLLGTAFLDDRCEDDSQRWSNARERQEDGHPLHPVFTDLPIGAWTTGLVLDAVAAANHDRAMERAADIAIAVGLAGCKSGDHVAVRSGYYGAHPGDSICRDTTLTASPPAFLTRNPIARIVWPRCASGLGNAFNNRTVRVPDATASDG